LERNYGAILQRRLLLEALMKLEKDSPGEVRLEDAALPLRKAAQAAHLFDDRMSSPQKLNIVKTWMMRESMGIAKDVSLETQGLLEIRLARPQKFVTPQRLAALGLDTEEAWNFIQLLLRTIRHRRVLSMPDGVDIGDADFMPGPEREQYIRKLQSTRNIFSWLPVTSTNNRVDMTMNLLRALNPVTPPTKADAVAILDEVWDVIAAPTGAMRGYLKSENVAREGIVFQLDYAMHELVPSLTPRGYVCSKCRKHAYVHVRGVCTGKNCTGTMLPVSVDADERTLYQRQYVSFVKTGMSVHEHSANLRNEDARDVQIKFTNGEINVLSCTTTFELGVDVGELQTVFLRNMPPSTANYIQRAGRAGRRDGATAMIVTYCQRRSHDLTYFDDPVAMISGIIPAPRLQTSNTKITRRHLYAIVLSAFLRYWKTKTDTKWPNKSGVFFRHPDINTDALNPVVAGLIEYIGQHPQAIKEAFEAVLTPELQHEMEVENWGWLGAWTEEHVPLYLNSLYRADHQLNNEFAAIIAALEEIRAGGVDAISTHNSQLNRLSRMLKTLEQRELFGVLPNFGLMPKYGFPTDVVQLKTDHIPNDNADRVELTRDLQIAIGEYAPGSQVVAAGLVWESGGIVIPGGRGLVAGKYMRCSQCEYATLTIGDASAALCRNCGFAANAQRATDYIVPEFGFIATYDSGKPVVGGRPPRGRASRFSFSGETMATRPRDRNDAVLRQHDIDIYFNRNVQLSAINEGTNAQGYQYCDRCGYATDKTADREHKSPITNRPCSGRIRRRISLVHNFVTDALEIQFNRMTQTPTMDVRSVLYAILEGASRLLHIERDEIDGTIYKTAAGTIRVVIFDVVPAGFALQIADCVPDVLRAARAHVATECCGPETSCYRCLRTYGNQYFHPVLKRGDALELLTQIVGE
jgi:hypothetical protein